MATPLIVIVGPTGSGKSAMAVDLAKQYNGEIICADSRTVYKQMDIGTAKPMKQEQIEVPHHLIDIITPGQAFTAADFKLLALESIKDIHDNGKVPIMVGGTGLYIDGVIFDFAFLPPVPQEERERLQQLSVEELQHILRSEGIPLPENKQNPRHLIRAIETNGAVPVKSNLRVDTLVLGLEISKEALQERIENRTHAMIEKGLKLEAIKLAEAYGWDAPGMSAVGYREWQESDDERIAEAAIVRNTMQYARRQRSWFKRNPHINWVKNSAEATVLVQKFLHN
jgi:tRNA dimethylallyltransferase